MEYFSNKPTNDFLSERKVDRKYRFHLLGFAHLPCSHRFYPCAFTNKLLKFSDMMLSLGHEVVFYGAETSDINCTEFIQTHTLKEIRDAWGDSGNNEDVGYDWKKEIGFRFEATGYPNAPKLHTKMIVNMVKELEDRLKPDDFIIFPMGGFHKPVYEQFMNHILKVENGIAYRDVICKFKAFESDFYRNYVTGLKGVGKETPNGQFYDRTIPNYFRDEEFPIEILNNKKDDNILFVGRLIPLKGLNIAIRLAEESKTKILMAGQGGLTGVSPYVELIGVLNPEQRAYQMSKARAVIVPTVYTEPFGGVAVEAMLCGTPIITTNFGVFPEYNINGVTGFRCDTFKDFKEALKKVDSLDRNVIRKHAERYLMSNVKWEFQKWFDDLFHFYQVVKSGDKKAQTEVWFSHK